MAPTNVEYNSLDHGEGVNIKLTGHVPVFIQLAEEVSATTETVSESPLINIDRNEDGDVIGIEVIA